MVISQGTQILLAALFALMRAEAASSLGCSPMRAPSHWAGPQQRCREGLLWEDQDSALAGVKELPTAPAEQTKSLLHSLGDKLTLLRVPGPVVWLTMP